VNLGVGWGRKNWSDPFPPPVAGDQLNIGGAIAGGQIGFNYQVGAAVWGLEADADWANIQGTNTCFAGIGGMNCGAKVKSIGTFAGRLGYAVDRTLLYVKGGGAWVNDEYSLNNSGVVLPPAAVVSTTTVNKWGWTIGAGIEHALSNNWTMKLEYNYVNFGSTAVPFAFAAPFNSFSIDQKVHLVKLGVNYKFDWGPVVAKY
jgi:opacity protein-like surface antigen